MSHGIATDALQAALQRQPRISLGNWPTPLEDAPRLSERLGVRILVKRDDLTGLALGGNKVRKLEFLIGDAQQRGANCIVTTGGSQSNHARLTAAACRRVGLRCSLILDRGVHPENQGNLLLDRLFGAEVTLIESDDPAVAADAMETKANELRGAGLQPYVIPRGGSVPAGATGYAAFVPELMAQLEERGITPTYLYLGTGSTGTHSGVLAGCIAGGWFQRTLRGISFGLQGISVSRPQAQQVEKIHALCGATLNHLGMDADVDTGDIHVDDRYRGRGYGIPTVETMEAVTLAALDEGLVLDPVYTGKAMAGLIGHAREGRFHPSDTVVFLHTGGAPALFAYNQETVDALTTMSP